MKLADHPTVKHFYTKVAPEALASPIPKLDAGSLRQLCLDCGAHDVGLVEIERAALDDQRADILSFFPPAKTLISFVCRLHHEPIRSTVRSVANLEFHQGVDEVDETARKIVGALQRRGSRAINPSMGFPMEMHRFPGKVWVVSHKPVAVAAGLGRMGIHRNVIHPKFGNFISLGTVLVDAEASAYDRPIEYNPCLECKLCVAACPVGAIAPDGAFNFSACYTHNYREFMGGFTDWVEQVADSRDARDYRRKVSDQETASMWQSLSFGANYKAAYCMAVCPAGEDVIGSYLTDRKEHLNNIVRPLQDKHETAYVLAGSDAEAHIARRFPNKKTKRVSSGLRPSSIRGFLDGLPLTFQRDASDGLEAVYHFTFTGDDQTKATVLIANKTLRVSDGHIGKPGLRVLADTQTWLGFLAKERNLVWAMIRRKIRLQGSPRLLVAFGQCFPS